MNKYILIVFIIGLALFLRLALFFQDYSWDVNNHISWAEDLIKHGFSEKFFTTISTNVFGSKYPNYPPLSLYLFYFLYPIQGIVHSIVWWLNTTFTLFPSNLIFFIETKTFLAGIFKVPSILADFGCAFLLFLFLNKLTKWGAYSNALFVSFAFLFNPIVFYNSSYWGQIDSIPLFFALLALYLSLYKKSIFLSVALLTISLLIKPNTIIFLPVFAYLFLSKFTRAKVVLSAGIGIFIFYLTYIPFNSQLFNPLHPIVLYWQTILDGQSMSLVSNGAYNFWTLFLPKADLADTTTIMGIISYRLVGYILFFLSIVLAFFLVRNEKSFEKKILHSMYLVSFSAFLFLTKMHERYVILFLPFLIQLAGYNKKYILVLLIVTLVGFLNMYNSWPVPSIDILREALKNHNVYRFLSSVFLATYIFSLFELSKDRTKCKNRRK